MFIYIYDNCNDFLLHFPGYLSLSCRTIVTGDKLVVGMKVSKGTNQAIYGCGHAIALSIKQGKQHVEKACPLG